MNFLDPDHIKNNVAVSPLVHGGSNFETQVLHQNSTHKISFKPSLGYALFCGLFSIFSFIGVAIGVYQYIQHKNLDFLIDNWFMVLWFILWTTGTAFLFRSFFMPIVFDKSIDRFYTGFIKDKTKLSKKNITLSKIVALQIIGEHVSGENSSFKSFELNIILDDMSRINIIDHSNLEGIIMDTETLSKFLNVPIWHATSNKS